MGIVLFYGGLSLMAASAAGALAAALALRAGGKRVARELLREYGEKE